ncbi:MAG: hypothetical protein LBP23_04990 [Treponema sp.]|jgi:hypothetical protein|nr:hypothetical protein [Treponema sp.]
MVTYKVGDKVRIRSKEWIEGISQPPVGSYACFNKEMYKYAGMEAIISGESVIDVFFLDIDSGRWRWESWMFDPDYKSGGPEPLPTKEAVRALLEGETLYDRNGKEYSWDTIFRPTVYFPRDLVNNLYRRPSRRKRPMTRWEVLAWASSEESHGWVVKEKEKKDDVWYVPSCFTYAVNTDWYERARLLPDLSGVDKSTIQGFETED